MKILHVNTSDIQGGAARAAYRLHQGLLQAGVDSQMLVQTKFSDDFTVIGPVSKISKSIGRIRSTLDQLPLKLYPNKKKALFSPAWLPFSRALNGIRTVNPDIVHLHWIAEGYLRLEDLARIKKPIIWSLHDMWAFTGGCHYDSGCGKYLQECSVCPVLGSSKENDFSRKVFSRKNRVYLKIPNLTINGLSRWLADCAKSSTLLSKRRVVNLPNLLDTHVFRPLPQQQAKEILGLSSQKKHILFGAVDATGDRRKGFNLLSQMLNKLENSNIELMVFGSSKPINAPDFPFLTSYLGRLQDDISLRVLYSAADVVVVPSRQENLSNVIMESLSCETPVVAFDIGGNHDMIKHKVNGYLAQPLDPIDLAKGVEWVLNYPNPEKLSKNTRWKVISEFNTNIVIPKYTELYNKVLMKSGSPKMSG